MLISKNNSFPSFKATYINVSKMNRPQKQVAYSAAEELTNADSYLDATKKFGFDVYILPSEKNSVEARFMDPLSEMFYKKDSKIISQKLDMKRGASPIFETIIEMFEGKIKKPRFESKQLLNDETDLMTLKKLQSAKSALVPGAVISKSTMLMYF